MRAIPARQATHHFPTIVAAPTTPSAPTLLPADSNGNPTVEATLLTSPYLTGTTEAGATVQLLNASGTVENMTQANGFGSYQVQRPALWASARTRTAST